VHIRHLLLLLLLLLPVMSTLWQQCHQQYNLLGPVWGMMGDSTCLQQLLCSSNMVGSRFM
jgi:hypothetical protein